MYMMKTFARRNGLTDRQKAFNYRLSRARNFIEDSFGILTARWQILQNRLDYKLETSISIVRALVCLHSFIIADELPQRERNRLNGVPTARGRYREDLVENEIIDEEVNIPADVEEQSETLADYFTLPEGGLR
ncbi:uncharacterized protein LOC117168230 [Belonocnema kinseyi]|uniref:uncharacterized protein LOC117168230 n=1 Tax=Belonocnema kinseyi TaxID=2817044 RepID=UPI00143CE199|nr:uncharacterized protein LOC117168230 [Belonocnema kinseyi]